MTNDINFCFSACGGLRSGGHLKAARFFLFLFFLSFVVYIQPAFAVTYPRHKGPVNDFARVLSPVHADQINHLAQELWQKTGTGLVVVTLPDLGGSDIETYATGLYEDWGIGKKGEDRGVLILLAQKERRVRIETGYGVEGILPDGLVGQILDDYVIPWFKRGDFSQGLLNGSLAIAQIVAQDAGVQLTGKMELKKTRRSSSSWPLAVLPLFLFFFLLLGRRRSRMGGLPFIFFPPIGRGGGFGNDDFGGFGGGFGGFGGGMSGGGGASRGF
ncbi:MAG: TPM domain-containing protein [Thermodesulfobacteriota bacterium]